MYLYHDHGTKVFNEKDAAHTKKKKKRKTLTIITAVISALIYLFISLVR